MTLIPIELRTKLNRQVIERLEADPPNDSEGLLRLSAIYRRIGDLPSARKALERIPEPQRDPRVDWLLAVLAGAPLPENVHLDGARPSPFALYDEFLDPSRCDELGSYVRHRREDFAPARVYTPDHREAPIVDDKARRSLVLSSPTDIGRWILPLIGERVAEALPSLGLSPFDLSDTEMHISASGDGDRLRLHQDVGPGAARRRIAYVLYFRPGEPGFEGGNFILYDTDPKQGTWAPEDFTMIEPRHNRLILFPGDAFHEVTEVRCDPEAWEARRFAVCGWFREPELRASQ